MAFSFSASQRACSSLRIASSSALSTTSERFRPSALARCTRSIRSDRLVGAFRGARFRTCFAGDGLVRRRDFLMRILYARKLAQASYTFWNISFVEGGERVSDLDIVGIQRRGLLEAEGHGRAEEGADLEEAAEQLGALVL